jgi:DNA-binding FadR family transcriptional regulator
MSQPKRNNKSLREVTAIWRAIQNGDPDLAEQCCLDHVNAAAVAALSMIERSSAPKTPESAFVQETRFGTASSDNSSD